MFSVLGLWVARLDICRYPGLLATRSRIAQYEFIRVGGQKYSSDEWVWLLIYFPARMSEGKVYQVLIPACSTEVGVLAGTELEISLAKAE